MQLETSTHVLVVENGRYELRRRDEAAVEDGWLNVRKGDVALARLGLVHLKQGIVVLILNGIDIGQIDPTKRSIALKLAELVDLWNTLGAVDRQSFKIATLFKSAPSLETTRKIKLQSLTWNCHGELASFSQESWRKLSPECDIIALHFQETDKLNRQLSANAGTLKNVCSAIGSRLPEHKCIANIQLLGIMSLVYVKETMVHSVSNVRTMTSSTGLFKMWGNKGATLIRFDFLKDEILGKGTQISIVNCHLSAGEGTSRKTRRLWELKEISSAFQLPGLTSSDEELAAEFGDVSNFLTLSEDEIDPDTDVHFDEQEHLHGSSTPLPSSMSEGGGHSSSPQKKTNEESCELVLIAGDFNYRILLPAHQAMDLIQIEDYASLLGYDSLAHERRAGKVFCDYHEGPINFPPTYKYEVGSEDYAGRVPSYTDRVLYKTKCAHSCISYESWHDMQSDHRPVSLILEVEFPCYDEELRAAAVAETLRLVDQAENRRRPIITVKPDSILGEGAVLSTVREILVLTREESSMPLDVTWSVSSSSGLMTSDPPNGVLPWNQTETRVSLRARLPVGSLQVNDVIIISVRGGSDSFVPVQYTIPPSCLGKSIMELCRTPKGARNGMSDKKVSNMPREIWACIDYLWPRIVPDMFRKNIALPGLCQQVLMWLDNGVDFDVDVLAAAGAAQKNADVYAVTTVLMAIFEYMKPKLIPYEPELTREHLLENLPTVDANVLIYLVGFFQHAILQGVDKTRLVPKLVPYLFDPAWPQNDACSLLLETLTNQ